MSQKLAHVDTNGRSLLALALVLANANVDGSGVQRLTAHSEACASVLEARAASALLVT